MSITKLILEIYDNILQINNNKVIVLFDKHKNIWFSLPHLLKALEYSTYRDEIKSINKIIDDNELSTYEKISNLSIIKLGNDNKIHPHTKMISEGGIYLLLNKSKKPLAIELKKQLYANVLPSLRKNGKFIVSKEDKKDLAKLNNKILKQSQKIKLYQQEIKRTQKQSYSSNKTGNGYIYVIEIDTPNEGKLTKCYKVGYTANIQKRMATYKTGNPNIKLIHHENIKCNKKQLEQCIINLNYLKKLKGHNEIICDISKDKILDEIEDCKKIIQKYSNEKISSK
jgi:prophage antirepressor-like protein